MPGSVSNILNDKSHRFQALSEQPEIINAEQSIRCSQPRHPVVPIAVGMITGILIDRYFNVRWEIWSLLSVLLLVSWWAKIYQGRRSLSAVLLILVFVVFGGFRHHIFWYVLPSKDVNLYFAEKSQLVRLRGALYSDPKIIREPQQPFRSAWQQYDQSRFSIACTAIASDTGWESVSGVVNVAVEGHVLHARVGDMIEVTGWVSLARCPQNPGGWDYQTFLRRQGIRSTLFTNHPDAVVVYPSEQRFSFFKGGLTNLQNEASSHLIRHINSENVPLAKALLLGDRTSMDDETREAFAESGTMHILAISGLHVGILASLVWVICQLCHLSVKSTSITIIVIVVSLSVLIEVRPPIMRATIFLSMILAGKIWVRNASFCNILAFTVLLMLIWNPADLFDIGAQLSFLAVFGIYCASRFSVAENRVEMVDGMLSQNDFWHRVRARSQIVMHSTTSYINQSCLMMAGIWIFTIPLAVAQFHIISPAGYFLSVILLPLVVLIVWSGYLFLMAGYLASWALPFLGICLNYSVQLLRSFVEFSTRVPGGHTYISGPPNWWLVGYYIFLAILVINWNRSQRRIRLITLNLFWIAVGLSCALYPRHNDNLRCTFLSVGHGCAVLVELPSGKTLLYDAGSLQDSRRAERAVEAALWNSGNNQLDAIVISHADIDHFNAVPGILQKIPVEGMLISKSFLDFEQSSVEYVCKIAKEQGVPIQLISEGDRILLDDYVKIEVLHPPAEWEETGDNASSVTLKLSYFDKSILLLGDIEQEGIEQIVDEPELSADVMMAPHHGSLAANTSELIDAIKPEQVIISSGRSSNLELLKQRYGKQVSLHSTHLAGAVTVELSPEGIVSVTSVNSGLEY